MFKCQNTQRRKLTWSARTVGPSGGTSVHHTPSCLLRPRWEGLRGKYSRSHRGNTWHLATVPATCLLLLGWAENRRGLLMCGKALGIQDFWEQRTTAHLAAGCPRYLPIVTNTLEVPSSSHGSAPVCPSSPAVSDDTLPFSPFSLLPQLVIVPQTRTGNCIPQKTSLFSHNPSWGRNSLSVTSVSSRLLP